MDNKSDRKSPSRPDSPNIVAGTALKGMHDALPEGGVLFDLHKAQRDEITAAIREESEKRLAAFYAAVPEGATTMNEQQARALIADPDFHALLRACIADIEAEKVTEYGALARGIASGSLTQENRRHFILSLRDLSADELVLLRKAFVAREYKLMPSQGMEEVGENELLSSGSPGSFQSIHVSNLTARGYIHEGKLSPLGAKFTQAICRPEYLTPDSLGYLTWSRHRAAIISYEIGTEQSGQIADRMTDDLRGLRCKSFIVAVTRDSVQRVRLNATRGILLVGDKPDALAAHISALRSLIEKIPTVGVLISPHAAVPDDLQLLGVVHYDQLQQVDGLSRVYRILSLDDDKQRHQQSGSQRIAQG